MDEKKNSFKKSVEKFDHHNQYVFIDFVGFETVSEFVCKEICLIDGSYEYHKIIKAPFRFSKLKSHERESVLWEIPRFSGIAWKSGDTAFEDVLDLLSIRLRNGVIIMDSEEKVLILKEMILKRFNFEYVSLKALGIHLNFNSSFEICDNHTEHNGYSQCQCAWSIATQMKSFVAKNLDFICILINTMKLQNFYHLSNQKNDYSDNKYKKEYIFVDLVEFHIDETLHFCKEFCLVDEDITYHKIVKSSDFENFNSNIQKSILWDASNKNGLKFNLGDVCLENIVDCLHKRMKNRKIIVENRYKAECLESMFDQYCNFECIALEDIGFELDYDERPEICSFHDEHNAYSHCECALSMVQYLENITRNNFDIMDALVSVNRIKRKCYANIE